MSKRSKFERKKRHLLGDNEEDNATFSSDDDGDLKLEQLTNLYMMANMEITKKEIFLILNRSINVDEVNDIEPQITFNELQDAFDEWFHEYKKVNNKNTLLQRKIWSISKDFDVLQKKKDALLTINIDLKRQLDSLKNTSNS